MCDGARGDGGEANLQGAVPSGLGEAFESVPEHLCQIWADLPCCARQRSRRRYFHAKIACANRAPSRPFDARIPALGAAVAELRSAVTGLPSGISARSGADSDSGKAATCAHEQKPWDIPADSWAQEPVLNAANPAFCFNSAAAVSRCRLL